MSLKVIFSAYGMKYIMNSVQEHIINKVFLEVNTRSPQTANYLKEHLDTFLKDELFPYLEQYFSSAEYNLPATIVQFPKVAIDLTVDGQSDFTYSFQETKEKVVAQIKKMMTPADPLSKEVIYLDTAQHTLRGLLHFLEEGNTPWWETAETRQIVTAKTLKEVTQSSSFSTQFKTTLQDAVAVERLIRQFPDKEIRDLLLAAFSTTTQIAILDAPIIEAIKACTLTHRLWLWSTLIEYLSTANAPGLLHSIYEQITAIETLHKDSHIYAFAKAGITIINRVVTIAPSRISDILIAVPQQKEQHKNSLAARIIKIAKQLDLTAESRSIAQLLTQAEKPVSDTVSQEWEEHSLHTPKIQAKTSGETETGISDTINGKQTDEGMPDKHRKHQDTTTNLTTENDDLSQKSGIPDDYTPSIHNPEGVSVNSDPSHDIKEEADQKMENRKTVSDVDDKKPLEPVHEDKDSGKESIPDVKADNPQRSLNVPNKEQYSDVTSQDSEKKIEKELEHGSRNTTKTTTSAQVDEATSSGISKDNTTTSQEPSPEKQEHSNALKTVPSSPQEQDVPDGPAFETATPPTNQENTKSTTTQQQEDIPHTKPSGQEGKEIPSPIKADTLPKVPVFEDSGTHHIHNAGLIIIHPFIKHFLQNCQLLKDTSIINKELAIHALHYVATGKEQQMESMMLFEKMLCGVPIKQPIARDIILPDPIKKQAHTLLQVVLENWTVLHNSSVDLLRHEFLQRPGLLSFKDENPKIVIERKTQDILLNKLPWGIGLCKLPWIDKLIFTDW